MVRETDDGDEVEPIDASRRKSLHVSKTLSQGENKRQSMIRQTSDSRKSVFGREVSDPRKSLFGPSSSGTTPRASFLLPMEVASRSSTNSMTGQDNTGSLKTRRSLVVQGQLSAMMRKTDDMSRDYSVPLVCQPMLGLASASCIKALAEEIESKFPSNGSFVVKHGESSDALFIVVAGTFNVYIGDEFIVELGVDDCFGELGILGVELRSPRTVKATSSDAELAVLRRAQFEAVLDDHPEEKRFFFDITSGLRYASVGCDLLRENVQIFEGLPQPVVDVLEGSLVHALMFPGQSITEDNDSQRNDLILVFRGKVSIQADGVETHTLERAYGETQMEVMAQGAKYCSSVAFGEAGLLSVADESGVSAIVHTTCHVGVLYRPLFLKVLEQFNESLRVEHVVAFLGERSPTLNSLWEAHSIHNVPNFIDVGLSKELLDFFARHLEERVFLAGQKIISASNADDTDKSMYIMSHGHATLFSNSEPPVAFGVLEEGDLFGEALLLGLVAKRSSNVVAGETCLVKVLSQSLVVDGLIQYPAEKTKMVLLAFKKKSGIEAGRIEKTSSFAAKDASDQAKHLNLEYKSMCKNVALQGVRRSELFAQVTQALPQFIDDLARVCVDRIYLPGDYVIEEGMHGDSMFVMLSGRAVCHVRPTEKWADKNKKNYVGVLEAGSICGELCMLGVASKRGATVEAASICCMWEVTYEAAMPIVQNTPEVTGALLDTIVAHQEHTVQPCLDALPLLRNFDRKFRMLIGLYGERRAFFPTNTIFKEGHSNDALYALNSGRALLECRGTTIHTYSGGNYFNAANMLGLVRKNMCSLVAFQTCHVITVSRPSFLMALEQYPSHEAVRELKQQEKAACENFKKEIRQLCQSNVMWKQCAQAFGTDIKHLRSQKNSRGESSIPSSMVTLVKKALKRWHEHCSKLCRVRKREQQHRKAFNIWVHDRRQAVSFRNATEQANPNGLLQPVSAMLDKIDGQAAPGSADTSWARRVRRVRNDAITPELLQPRPAETPGARTVKQDRLFSLYTADPREVHWNNLPSLLPQSPTPNSLGNVWSSSRPGTTSSIGKATPVRKHAKGGDATPRNVEFAADSLFDTAALWRELSVHCNESLF